MKIGILCECQRKRRFFRRMRVRTLVHPCSFYVTVAELGVSAERLLRIREKRPKKFLKILMRAERVFISECIKNIVVANPLKQALDGFTFNCVSAARGENEFYRFLPQLIGQYKEERGLSNSSSLGVLSFDADHRVEFLVDKLYREFKSINVYIENSDHSAAEELAERVFDETGLLLGVSDLRGRAAGAEDVFVDLRCGRLRVGRDLIINKIELDIDMLGYDISSADLFAAAELKKCAIKCCGFC